MNTETCNEGERNQGPYEGMVFESEEAARTFYDEYARRVGFTTRVISSLRSERDGLFISRRLGCRDCGSQQELREIIANQKRGNMRKDCTAMMLVKRENLGRWVVKKFVRDHDHSLLISTLHKNRLTFDEKDKRIEELTAELRVKKRLTAAYREQLLMITKDIENHNEHVSLKLQVIHSNLRDLEAKRQKMNDEL